MEKSGMMINLGKLKELGKKKRAVVHCFYKLYMKPLGMEPWLQSKSPVSMA
jgi:hypothetical protein